MALSSLSQRVITALVLLAILLPAIFIAPPWVWGALTLAFLTVAASEWARLLPAGSTPSPSPTRWLLPAVVLALGVVALWIRERQAWPPGALRAAMAALVLFWVLVGSVRLRTHRVDTGGSVLVGVLLFGCWLSLDELRRWGTMPLLSSMAVVWVADIGAYFVGRSIGRRKLAPTISPGKSWEGAIGGVLAVLVLGLVALPLAAGGWPALRDSLPLRLLDGLGLPVAALILLVMVALSIVGDLHESLLKRRAGVKDSGKILPGHGGVLDRIDALIPTMPLAVLLYDLLR